MVAETGWATSPISFVLNSGQLALLTGPGGSGKSLFAEKLAGIHRPGIDLRGKLSLTYRESSATFDSRTPRVALVPQDARLAALPTDRVSSLLSAIPDATGWLERLGLDRRRIRSMEFRALSLSERKRVLLVRSLGSYFDLLVVDGYGETLDPHGQGLLLDVVDECCASGKMVLMTSREPEPAGVVANAIAHLGPTRQADSGVMPLLRRSARPPATTQQPPLIEVQDVVVARGRRGLNRRPAAYPVDGATLDIARREVLVLLGASGSGKTTLLESIAGLRTPAHGMIRLSGRNLHDVRGVRQRRLQRQIQLVFQDAPSVLEGRRTVREHLLEAQALGRAKTDEPNQWLERLGLAPHLIDLPADVLSSSEATRVDLARSLAVSPRAVLFDEPRDSGLESDRGVLASVIHAEKFRGLSFLIATSEPEIARTLSDRVAIFDGGQVVEIGTKEEVLNRPAHPRTPAFLEGQPLHRKDQARSPTACAFAESCNRRGDRCEQERPPLRLLSGPSHSSHRVACFYPLRGQEAPPPPSDLTGRW